MSNWWLVAEELTVGYLAKRVENIRFVTCSLSASDPSGRMETGGSRRPRNVAEWRVEMDTGSWFCAPIVSLALLHLPHPAVRSFLNRTLSIDVGLSEACFPSCILLSEVCFILEETNECTCNIAAFRYLQVTRDDPAATQSYSAPLQQPHMTPVQHGEITNDA
jgi:hypothetical protein